MQVESVEGTRFNISNEIKQSKVNLSEGRGSNRLLPIIDSRQKCE